jgi:tetratricopeptide (TPR) repeat protein
MPLSRLIGEHLAGIRTFLADPEATVLELRALPEQEVMMVKLLAGLARELKGLFIGIDGAFTGAAAFCARIEKEVADTATQLAPTFAEQGRRLEAPVERASEVGPEARAVAVAERFARDVYLPFGFVALVLKPASGADRAAFAACVRQLGEAAEGGHLKIVVISDAAQPVAEPGPLPRRRLSPLVLDKGETPASAVARFVRDPAHRVLVHRPELPGDPWLAGELRGLAEAGHHLFVAVEVPLTSAGELYASAARALLERFRQLPRARRDEARMAPLLARAQRPPREADAEYHFLSLLDDLAAIAAPDGSLIVLVNVQGDGSPEMLVPSLQWLGRGAVSPRTKVVVQAPRLTLAAGVRRAGVQVQDLRIDGAAIEKGIGERLNAPDASPVERMRLTSALASFAAVKGDSERAVSLGLEALEMARQTGRPEEVAIAHHGLGSSLYRASALPEAQQAFTAALEAALECDQPALVAQALLGVGQCQFAGRQHDEALRSYTLARANFAQVRFPVGECYALTWQAESHARSGRYPDAERVFREALACCDRVGPDASSSRVEILQRLAATYEKMGKSAERQRCLDQARAAGETAPVAEVP